MCHAASLLLGIGKGRQSPSDGVEERRRGEKRRLRGEEETGGERRGVGRGGGEERRGVVGRKGR